MSTLENNLAMELAERIARARGPVQWNLLLTEINESCLPVDVAGTLRELLTQRVAQERDLAEQIFQGQHFSSGGAPASQANIVKDHHHSKCAAVGTLTLAEFDQAIERAAQVTDISRLINVLPYLAVTPAERDEAAFRLFAKRELLMGPCGCT